MVFPISIGMASILFYLAAWLYLFNSIKQLSEFRRLWYIPTIIALLLHAVFLYTTIDKAQLQNLAWPNLFSVTVWLAGVMVTLFGSVKKAHNLCLLIFPLAILAILMQFGWQGNDMVNTGKNVPLLIHILLSIIAMAGSLIAMVQALLLAGQNYLLHRQIRFRWLMLLPPVDAMEQLLFNLISFNFILLTLTLISALWLLHGLEWRYLLPKATMSLSAWVVFGILLIGRHKFGWYGKIAIRCTLIGFFILLLVYTQSG
ncbi:MAG: inner membrane protein YpjD [Gammaproteobacteria bacterium]